MLIELHVNLFITKSNGIEKLLWDIQKHMLTLMGKKVFTILRSNILFI